MDSVATSSHLPALMKPHQREALCRELEATLHDLVSLSLIGKQLHWAVVGQHFRPLHQQLDELVDSWRDLSDVVAERAVALGNVPDGQAQAVAAGSEIGPVARTAIDLVTPTVVGRRRHIRDSDRHTSLLIERRSACDSLEGDETWLTGVACLPTSVGTAPLGGM